MKLIYYYVLIFLIILSFIIYRFYKKIQSINDANYINNYFDKIYVINLLHRKDRKLDIINKTNKINLNVSFIEAVYGKQEPNLSEYKRINKTKIFKGWGKGTPGVWGCLQSHIKIYKDALKNNYKKILILEDDIIFHKNFNSLCRQKLEKWKNFKILYLSGTQHRWKNIKIEEDFYRPYNTNGGTAYALDRSILAELIRKAESYKITKYWHAIDTKPLNSLTDKYRKFSYVCYPNLIIQDVTESDTNERHRSQQIMAQKFRWNLDLYE